MTWIFSYVGTVLVFVTTILVGIEWTGVYDKWNSPTVPNWSNVPANVALPRSANFISSEPLVQDMIDKLPMGEYINRVYSWTPQPIEAAAWSLFVAFVLVQVLACGMIDDCGCFRDNDWTRFGKRFNFWTNVVVCGCLLALILPFSVVEWSPVHLDESRPSLYVGEDCETGTQVEFADRRNDVFAPANCYTLSVTVPVDMAMEVPCEFTLGSLTKTCRFETDKVLTIVGPFREWLMRPVFDPNYIFKYLLPIPVWVLWMFWGLSSVVTLLQVVAVCTEGWAVERVK